MVFVAGITKSLLPGVRDYIHKAVLTFINLEREEI